MQPAVSNPQDSTQVGILLSEGDKHYAMLDNQMALESYRNAYRLDSASFSVLTRLTRSLSDYGLDLETSNQRKEAKFFYQESIEVAEKLLVLFPDSVHTYFHLANSKSRYALYEGGFQKALIGQEVEKHCKKGLSLDSTHAELLVTYAVFKREVDGIGWIERTVAQAFFGPIPEGSKDLSIKMLARAIELAPRLHVAHYELALTYITMGKHDDAVPHLETVRMLPPLTTPGQSQ